MPPASRVSEEEDGRGKRGGFKQEEIAELSGAKRMISVFQFCVLFLSREMEKS